MASEVLLQSAHLVIGPMLANELFANDQQVLVSYQPNHQRLLVSPVANQWFATLHKAKTYLLKSKDAHGTRSIGIHELLIDHDIAPHNRAVPFELNQQRRYLKLFVDQPTF